MQSDQEQVFLITNSINTDDSEPIKVKSPPKAD